MKNLLILTILLYSLGLNAQSWRWVNYVEGGGNHYAFDAEVDDFGNVYSCGRYRAYGTFYGQDADIVDPYFAGSRDVFITKVDSNGNYLWLNTEGGAGSDYALNLITDEFGNLYVTGTTADSAYFESTGVLSDSNGDVFVAKYDSDGNLIWINTFSGDVFDYGVELECDKNGHIYIGGVQSGNFDYGIGILPDLGYFIMKMDYSGNVKWCVGPSNLEAGSRTNLNGMFLRNSELYFAGRVRDDVTFGTITIGTATAWDDIYFSKMDTTGTVEWARTAGGSVYDEAMDIVVKDTSVYIVGAYGYNADFDTVSVSSSLSPIGATGATQAINGRDAFVAKYNSDGSSCYWVKEVKSDKIDEHKSVIINANNEIVVTGIYDGKDIYSAASEGNMAIRAYDSDGDLVWSDFPLGLNVGEGYAITQNTFGTYYFAGASRGEYEYESDVIVTADIGKYSGLIGMIYPKLELGEESLFLCLNDSITIHAPDGYGSPLNYQWIFDGTVLPSETNDSVKFDYADLSPSEVACVIWHEHEIDTIVYLIEAGPIVELGPNIITCDSLVELNAGGGADYYDWGFVGSPTDSVVTVSSSGDYSVSVTQGSCVVTDSITVTILDCLGIHDFDYNVVASYNSDTKEFVIISSDEEYSIKVYEISGKLLFAQNGLSQNENIYFNFPNSGIVILEYNGQKRFIKKIFVTQ